MVRVARRWILLGVLGLVGCAPGGPPLGGRPDGEADAVSRGAARTFVVAIRVEPTTLASRGLRDTGVAQRFSRHLFNAELTLLDDRATPVPYLAEALPQLHTETWRVFPDGRMETTYRLRPQLAWHDRVPSSAEDFVFAWRVLATPEFGFAGSLPISAMDEVTAADPRTLVIRWRQPYPDAGTLRETLPAMARHVLEAPFQPDQLDAFRGHPYWTRAFVGLGPFRLDRWEPGAFIEASAFDRHILGRPRIERVRLVFSGDSNATLARLLAGEVHLAADGSLSSTHTQTLRQEWATRDPGKIIPTFQNWRATYFQARLDLAAPPAILDRRVRRALAHGVDRQAVNEAVSGGEAFIVDSMFPSASMYGPGIDRVIVRYPYDVRRSEQLMGEAGFRKIDGFYGREGEGRFSPELKTNAGTDNETEMTIMASGWRQAGFDIQEAVLPVAQAQDNQVRSAFPGMYTNSVPGGDANLPRNTTAEIARPENRWRGANRAGWSHPEYDRLADVFSMALDRDDRILHAAQMARIVSEEVPAISLYFATVPWGHHAALRGPKESAPESSVAWDVYRWVFE